VGLKNSKFGSSSPLHSIDEYGHEKSIVNYRTGGRGSIFVIMFSVVNSRRIIGSSCAICCIFAIA